MNIVSLRWQMSEGVAGDGPVGVYAPPEKLLWHCVSANLQVPQDAYKDIKGNAGCGSRGTSSVINPKFVYVCHLHSQLGCCVRTPMFREF